MEHIPRPRNITIEHLRLLSLISRYSRPGEDPSRPEPWIRKLPLQVFMYEGIVSGVFDWDYSPASIPFLDSREYLNISQEGEDDINDLREDGYVNSMRISTARHRFIEAYQITLLGLELISDLDQESLVSVDGLVSCPECGEKLHVKACELPGVSDAASREREIDSVTQCLIHCLQCSYSRVSGITEIEDVSYASSPFISTALCEFPSLTPSRHASFKGLESGGTDNIRDRLDELIILDDTRLMIGEWIPFGANHIAALNEKIGARERVKNALFTQVIDQDPGGTELMVMPGLTQVFVRGSKPGENVSFDASIMYPEDDGIEQIEEFGVHVNMAGQVVYGLKVESIAGHDCHRVSLDHLSRLLADVSSDSSRMMETLLTSYQRTLLSLVFLRKSRNRDKYALVMARDISPRQGVADFLDAESMECELKQILEEVVTAENLPDGSLLFVGTHGTLMITGNPEKYEAVASDFLFLKSMDLFMQNFFSSQFILNDTLRDVQNLISLSERDPNAIEKVQMLLSESSGDAVLMKEIQGYLMEALTEFNQALQKRKRSRTLEMNSVGELLAISEMAQNLTVRVRDMEKIIHGIMKSLEGMAAITDVITERQMHRLQEALHSNTRNLEDVTRSSERTGVSLEIMEVILSGTLAFDILDRLTGEWSAMSTPDPATWGSRYFGPLISIPGVWFCISMLLWVAIAYGLFRFMAWLQAKAEPVLISRVKMNIPCNLNALETYLATKNIIIRDVDCYAQSMKKKVSWVEMEIEKWGVAEVKIELFYDDANGYLLSFLLEVPEPGRLRIGRLNDLFMEEILQFGVIARS